MIVLWIATGVALTASLIAGRERTAAALRLAAAMVMGLVFGEVRP